MRGATRPTMVRSGSLYFNPRSPCGERPGPLPGCAFLPEFQSTLPMRGATPGSCKYFTQVAISIHAPHAGSDLILSQIDCKGDNFNPRSPCGERRGSDCATAKKAGNFNPRSPCGERHFFRGIIPVACVFQSTLPMRGATQFFVQFRHDGGDFNPRSPCGERRATAFQRCNRRRFQSTLPMRGAT